MLNIFHGDLPPFYDHSLFRLLRQSHYDYPRELFWLGGQRLQLPARDLVRTIPLTMAMPMRALVELAGQVALCGQASQRWWTGHERAAFHHATVQAEKDPDLPCALAPDHVV
jgi:hypothetical protein